MPDSGTGNDKITHRKSQPVNRPKVNNRPVIRVRLFLGRGLSVTI